MKNAQLLQEFCITRTDTQQLFDLVGDHLFLGAAYCILISRLPER
jgi:hypothetical protein